MERKVRVNYSDQGDIGKMQAFGNHLRADEHVNFARAKIAQHAPIILFALHDVRIHAAYPGVRKKFAESVLYFLRSQARIADFRVAAFWVWANGRHVGGMAADMAGKPLLSPMVGE